MQGFYKEHNGFLVWSADRVLNENFELWLDKKDTYTYPVEGWYWFDSEIEARNSLECYSPSPYSSWILNKETAQFEPPVSCPIDGNEYFWNERTIQWEYFTPSV